MSSESAPYPAISRVQTNATQAESILRTVLPDVPTVAESVLTVFEIVSWYGLWGPARMPAELTQRIRNEVAKALASEKAVKVLDEYGFSATASQPGGLHRIH